jgi:RNA-directed DNA polymerase
LRSPTVTPKLQRIAAQAARDPDRVFTTLAHLIDVDFLREAYRHTSKASAPGIDGVTAQQYAEHLDENLHDLHERLRSGRYQAMPVERVWIEKEDGKQRPIGKPTFEDKIVQRAVAMLLEAIYEQDFSDSSYGFRRGRSPHDALDELRERCMRDNIGWIVDADVSGYFECLSAGKLLLSIYDCLTKPMLFKIDKTLISLGLPQGINKRVSKTHLTYLSLILDKFMSL